MHELSEEEQRKVAAQVEFFMELVAKKYSVNPDEILETVRWVRERKAFADKIRATGLVSLIGLLVSAASLAMWEGLKAMVNRSN